MASGPAEKYGQGGEGPGMLSKAAAAVQQTAHDVATRLKVGDLPEGDPRRQDNPQPYPAQNMSSPGEENKMDPAPDFGVDTYKGTGRLLNKKALITGGDSGIGRAVALAFAREGADVAISYLNEHKDAEETRRWVQDAGRQAVLIPGDISTEAGCKAAVAKAADAFGRIDILVNNAAFQGKAVESIMEINRDRLERTFATNIMAMFSMIQAALPHMTAPAANIINTTSVQAYSPIPAVLDYATTKGAIVAFTKGLAQELIKSHGIRVNAVAPGPVWTPIMPASFPGEYIKTVGQDQPAGRVGQPRELAPAYVFLASEEASFVNAEILGVTGGTPTG